LKWWKRNHDHKAELARDPAQAAKKVMTDAKYYDDILFEHLVQESAKSSTNAVKQSSNH
jgi:hypothetical protein